MTELNPQEQRDVVKQAIKEWMDEQYARLGRWTIGFVCTAALTMFLFKYIEWRGGHLP
jgi:hypothetical protein